MANLTVSSAVDTFMQGLTQANLRTALALGNSSTLNVGTASGTVAAGDDSRIVNAIQTGGNAALNSLTLVTQLAAIYGGTGQAGYATGDILFALNSTTLSRLSSSSGVLYSTGSIPSWSNTPTLAGLTLNVTPLSVVSGGTGANSASGARTNLGISATGADTTYAFRANNLSDLASASTARTNLGVTATGADTTYAFRANNLSDLASASTARTNLGLGTMAVQNASSVAVTGGTINGTTVGATTPASGAFTTLTATTPVAITSGGTGATTASGARTNLGVTATGADTTYNFRANNLSDVASASTARTNLGLGTMATQNANSIAVTGGFATGLSNFSADTPANLRTIKNNIHAILNVKDFGAVGDNSTNDTVAIAAAVTAMTASNAVLYFPAGIYLSDTVAITGKTGLTIFGDGNGTSTLKHRTGGVVMTVASSTGVSVHDMTFDGNLAARTAGQTAVTFDVSNGLIFTNNTIKNAGQYNILVGGGSTQNTNVNITNNVLLGGYADGINIQYVSRFVVANNTIDGVDDDCIAIGYNPSGFATQGVVSNNFCRARSDLGTNTGRGIWIGKANDILVEGNNIDTVKQTGIWVSDDGTGTRPARISVKNNKVRNVATSSGHGIAVYKADYVTLEGNTVENPAQGSCIEIADWNYLSIKGGTLTQSVNTFGRGIHADESGGWGASWTNLMISDVDIRMIGASTDICIYLAPDSSVTMNTGSITGVNGYQVNGTTYIAVDTARMGTLWKIGNNTTLVVSGGVSPGSSAGIYAVFNNN